MCCPAEFWLCNAIANPLKLAEFFGQMKRHGFKSKVVKPPLGFDPIAIVLFFKPPLLEEGGDDTSAKSTASTQSPASGSTAQVRSLTALGMAWAKAAAADMSSRTTPHPSPAKEIATAGQRNFGSQRERLVMYTLQCFYIVVIKTVRAGIPMMTPLIARDLHFSEAESAFVLSGFFQGSDFCCSDLSAVGCRGCPLALSYTLRLRSRYCLRVDEQIHADSSASCADCAEMGPKECTQLLDAWDCGAVRCGPCCGGRC